MLGVESLQLKGKQAYSIFQHRPILLVVSMGCRPILLVVSMGCVIIDETDTADIENACHAT